MLRMNAASNNVNCVEILGDDARTFYPIDIKYNRYSLVYDILARNEEVWSDHYFEPPMQIYHVTPAVINNQTSYGDGTRYLYNDYYLRLWSIAPLLQSDYFVASGDFGQMPWLFRYKHNEWEYCPERFEYLFCVGNPTGIVKEYSITKMKYSLKAQVKESRVLKIPVGLRCGHISK